PLRPAQARRLPPPSSTTIPAAILRRRVKTWRSPSASARWANSSASASWTTLCWVKPAPFAPWPTRVCSEVGDEAGRLLPAREHYGADGREPTERSPCVLPGSRVGRRDRIQRHGLRHARTSA